MTGDKPWLKSYPKEVAWDAAIEPRPVFALLEDAAAAAPGNPYLEFQGRGWSYAETLSLARRAAKGLAWLGVRRGVKVALYLPNCPQFVISYFAILMAGGTVVNCSPLYSESELIQQIEDAEADILITLDLKALYSNAEAILRKTRVKTLIVGTLPEVLPFPKNWLFPLLRRKDIARVPTDGAHIAFSVLIDNDGDFAPPEIDPETDIAVLQYTGGTTGTPKGAMLTHANVHVNARQVGLWHAQLPQGDECTLGALPLFHVFAMTVVMNMATLLKGRLVLHPRFVLEDVLKDIAAKKVTILPGVPTMFTAFVHHPGVETRDFSALKSCITGGAPMPLDVIRQWKTLSGIDILEGYGLSECSPVVSVNPIQGAKVGSIGLPLPGTRIVIVDKDDPKKVLPQGEKGEITVEGPQVMKGYWNKPEETANALVDGRLRTGDVGYMDEDGFTFIIDRMKDMILVSGFNVFPRHIEEAINDHPAVAEVIVIGVPDDYHGETPKAFVRLKSPEARLTTEELRAFLKDRLGRHEMPSEIEFRTELPKTLVGKLSKKELIEEERQKRAAKAG